MTGADQPQTRILRMSGEPFVLPMTVHLTPPAPGVDAAALDRRGFTVSASDGSAAMVEQAAARFERDGLRIDVDRCLRADLATVMSDRFDRVAVCRRLAGVLQADAAAPRHRQLHLVCLVRHRRPPRRGCQTLLVSDADDRSRLSIRSKDSFLCIGSRGSVLSVGSIGSVLSVGSIGSAGSIVSIGSVLSAGSVMSGLSFVAVMSWRRNRALMGSPRPPGRQGTVRS